MRGVLSDTTMWRGPERAEEAAVLTRAILNQKLPGRTVPTDEDGSGILLMDEPDHMRIREPFAKALYKRVAKSKPLVAQVVKEWLDRVDGRDDVRRHDRFRAARSHRRDRAHPGRRQFASRRIPRLERRRHPRSSIPSATTSRRKHCVRSGNALSAYMRDLMARRRANPEDDLVSDMVMLQEDGAPLTDGEISNNLQGLLIGGNLTTTDLIGNGVWLLLTHPRGTREAEGRSVADQFLRRGSAAL